MAKTKNTAMKCYVQGTLSEDSIKQVRNGELRTQLRTILSALRTGNKAGWQYAYAVHKAINGNTYNEDFGSLSNYAKFLDTTKGRLSEKDNAVQFLIRNNLMPYTTDNSGKVKIKFEDIEATVSSAYELSTIAIKRTEIPCDDGSEPTYKHDSYEDFKVFAGTEEPYKMSVAAIKKLKKEFYEALEPKQIESEQETGEQETGEQETSEQTSYTKQDALNAITQAIIQFEITEAELKDCYSQAILNR